MERTERTKKKKLKIIPLGGLGEIGKNITVFEYGNDIIVVDCGMTFPDDEMLGVDLVLPDISYLVRNKSRIRGIVVTHGHEDHIGNIPYALKQFKAPVYGTRLALGLLQYKLEEHKMLSSCQLHPVEQGQIIRLGVFEIEFIRSNHSIPDTVALAIRTPEGIVVHTSDFKIDYTPVSGEPIDLQRFAELGNEGVLLLMSDSTNAERPGYTMSEKSVGKSFEDAFSTATGRIIVASFASNIHRVQQVVDMAVRFNRKVAVCGRSMENVCSKAIELGYLHIPEGVLVGLDQLKRYPHKRQVILSTGSQGEPMAALSRMAAGSHNQIVIKAGDLVIVSATPIPGNEKSVSIVINELFRRGAEVIYDSMSEVHVSGHACQEELKIMYKLVSPQYFMPIHGEYRHLKKHSDLVENLGMSKDHVFIMDIGQVLEIESRQARIAGTVPSGKVLVDGLSIGDVGKIVLHDRKHLSEDGMVIVVITTEKETGHILIGPEIMTKGFMYGKESENISNKLVEICEGTMKKQRHTNEVARKDAIQNALREYIYKNTKRRPMILTMVMEM
jgi:ribonuclease J